jgi:hypothetical protein
MGAHPVNVGSRYLPLHYAQRFGQMKEKCVGIATVVHAHAVDEQNPRAIGPGGQLGDAQEFGRRRSRDEPERFPAADRSTMWSAC